VKSGCVAPRPGLWLQAYVVFFGTEVRLMVSEHSRGRGLLRKAIVVLLGLVMSIAGGVGCASPSDSPGTGVVGAGIGNYAPDFTLVDTNGEGVTLSSFAGRPVLLNFWASWCSPCRQEMPYLQQIYEEQSPKGLAVFAINIQEAPARVKAFLSDNSLSLPVLFDLTGGTTTNYGIGPIPTTYFIDSKGVIRQKVVGAFPSKQAIEKELRKILAE
jgi:thiol-disulfide isomerase/thioredoxin